MSAFPDPISTHGDASEQGRDCQAGGVSHLPKPPAWQRISQHPIWPYVGDGIGALSLFGILWLALLFGWAVQ